ncbi:MAG: hypothetical protein FWC87_16210 [Acidimicrobiaceae bacterium]|nr:hypothetical protein [Acidimicrobiaceae bacterium]
MTRPQGVTRWYGFGSNGAPAEVVDVIDAPLDASRVTQLAASFGCPADIEAITQVLLTQTELGDEAYPAVWSSVDHLVRYDAAWRSMQRGVVPPSLRAQALAVTYRNNPTDPADSVPAVVLAAVGQAIQEAGRSRLRSDGRTPSHWALGMPRLARLNAGPLLRSRALLASRIRRPGGAANLNS